MWCGVLHQTTQHGAAWLRHSSAGSARQTLLSAALQQRVTGNSRSSSSSHNNSSSSSHYHLWMHPCQHSNPCQLLQRWQQAPLPLQLLSSSQPP